MGQFWNVEGDNGQIANPLAIKDGAGQFLKLPVLTSAERTALSPANGYVVFDSDLNAIYSYVSGAWQQISNTLLNQEQCCFEPVVPATGSSGQTGTDNYVGGAFRIPMIVQINRFLIRLTAQSSGSGPGIKVLIFQTDNGLPGSSTNVPKLRATMSASGLASGAQDVEMTPSEGTVTLLPGVVYILHGRVGSGPSFQCFTMPTITLLTTGIPTGADWIAPAFTTTISTALTPATFDVRQVADGGEATPTNSDTCIVNRGRVA